MSQKLTNRQTSHSGSRAVYVPFVERGKALLERNGLLGVIIPNKFVTADYGTAFRGLIANDRLLRHFVDFESELVFSGVSTYCCLTFLGCRSSESVTVARGTLQPPVARDLFSLPSSSLGIGPWSLRPAVTLNHVNVVPLKSACKAIFQGLITGGDSLLIGTRNGAFVHFTEDHVRFEPGIFRPLLKGSDVHRFTLDFSEHYVIYPYTVIDDRTELMSEAEIATQYPAAYEYLCRHRNVLEMRGSESMVYPAWYAHWCPRTIDRFSSPKIVTQVLASRASFALDLQGNYAFVGGGNAGVYGIIPNAPDEDRLWLLMAILNSNIFDRQVQARSSRFRGNYFSYARRFIEDVTIPSVTGIDLSSDDVRQVVELAKRRTASVNGQDIVKLESELDAAVDEMYHYYPGTHK